ncbi:beta-ketoacyl synthase N-terminal-like domain-containing protein [Hymenobacter chitinivorans]|uniref:3-oxoacyl-(Acyl-carrier-protein) synthase n=1 Tax=Hymenobacter chitinivorans DSM 11115 TaxID=1121954 RepID=A0A2M9BPE6_9BACT|nr:beta-ketoacyl synthase N-terminal-like domain-containing protein [Hymenobacter chitinivorans]PJJ59824.1 3-oxoacyl-(acyl-carrier-protein) synthase [Hymenobacter chitinivorans DSM 11115]
MTNSAAADSLIVIRGRGRVSALGPMLPNAAALVPAFHMRELPGRAVAVGRVPLAVEEDLQQLRRAHAPYRQLDRTVLLALLAARQATAQAGWPLHPASPSLQADSKLLQGDRYALQPASTSLPLTTDNQPPTTTLAVSIGSSRGATGRMEQFHEEFLAAGAVPAAASPLTTMGNVASWVAYDAGTTGGAALSHSSTCSSAFQALGNALAWLRAGMADRFLAGGTEAPLTDFTLAQMQALGIYSPFAATEFPCRPGAGRPSTFVLGEGAAVFALEKVSREALAAERASQPTAPVFCLEGVGFGFEAIGSKTGLSADGQHFQTAMREALRQAGTAPETVDAVVLHSPGTPAGDAAERAALRAVFGENLPDLVSNKWLLGHTLGASAALSLDFACEILTSQQWPAPPFATDLTPAPTRPIRRVLINAAGFGGNAASALVSVV